MTVGSVLATILWLYLFVLIARLVLEYVQFFARDWRPRGAVLVVVEAIYTVTDPPLRLLRKAIPPLRLGGVALDLSFIVLFIAIQLLIVLVARI